MDAWIDVLTRDEGAADGDLDIDYATYASRARPSAGSTARTGWPARTSTAFVRDVAARSPAC
jgi:hypothetical protein